MISLDNSWKYEQDIGFKSLKQFIFKSLCLSTESKQGRMVDALAHSGDEGRDKLR